jgi:hypothetical protein
MALCRMMKRDSVGCSLLLLGRIVFGQFSLKKREYFARPDFAWRAVLVSGGAIVGEGLAETDGLFCFLAVEGGRGEAVARVGGGHHGSTRAPHVRAGTSATAGDASVQRTRLL